MLITISDRPVQVGPLGKAKGYGCLCITTWCMVLLVPHSMLYALYMDCIHTSYPAHLVRVITPNIHTPNLGKTKEQAMEEYITKVEQLKEKYC